VDPQPLQPRPSQALADCIGTANPATSVSVAADDISAFGSDDETEGTNPCTGGSGDMVNDRESRVSNERNWKPFPKIAKVAMKTQLFRPRTRDVPAAGAKRVSRMISPLNQTWYKERDGWRWVERDLGDVLAELRKLR